MTHDDSSVALRAEIARLVTLLETHGIDWRVAPHGAPLVAAEAEQGAVEAHCVDEQGTGRVDAGIFGKAVTAAALIAQRRVNTLVLVHRTELLNQWQERLQAFLGVGQGVVGTIGGGKTKPTGKIDIGVMQSLSRQGEINPLVENYGHVIVDECHHVGAVSFDAILKRVKAKYVLGLTATPFRRDGQHPIIFMQCGSIRYTAGKPTGSPHDLEVVPRSIDTRIDLPQEAGIQDAFRQLAKDPCRTEAIAAEIKDSYDQGRRD